MKEFELRKKSCPQQQRCLPIDIKSRGAVVFLFGPLNNVGMVFWRQIHFPQMVVAGGQV